MAVETQPSANEGRGWFSWAARKARRENPFTLSPNNVGVQLEKKNGLLWFLNINTNPVKDDPRIKKSE